MFFDSDNVVNTSALYNQLSKGMLDFGIDTIDQCPINVVLKDYIIVENRFKTMQTIRFHLPSRSHKFALLFSPMSVTLPPVRMQQISLFGYSLLISYCSLQRGKKKVEVEFVVKCSTIINEKIALEIVGNVSRYSSQI